MSRNTSSRPASLISQPALEDLGAINWTPRRIGIAGVRFNTGAAGAAGDGKAGEAAAGAAGDGKAGDGKAGDGKGGDAAAAAAAAAGDGKGTKTGDAAADGTAGKAGDEGQPKVAPDKYELTIPDEAKAAVGDAISDIQADVEADAKANGWTNEEAQGELDARLERANERLTKLRDGWLKETEADATYGGDNLAATQASARKVVDAIRPEGHPRREAFLRLLNGSGIGNNLEVVSFLADLGKHMGEDSPALGRQTGKQDAAKRDADVLFPTSAPKA